jgi:2-octaprenylphenol hydroxylase
VPDISVLALDTGSQITAGWGYRLKTDAGVMETRLLVGADGAHSSIRKLAGFRTREWDYDHHALVTTLRTEKPHGKTARQWFHPGGPLAFLPLAMEEDHLVSMVLSCRPALADQYQTLSLEALGRKLTHMSEGALGPVEVLEAPVRFPLRQRHATRYVKNGLVLVGDAAHTIHPLAGQGANLGLMDVRDLAHQLEGIRLDDGIRLQSALHAWQRRRMPENLAMMAAMEGFQRLFSEAPGPVRWLRNRGLNLTGQLPLVKRQIIRQAMGLQLFE